MAGARWDGEIQWILSRERANGGPFWSREDGNVHAPAGFSALLVLNVLGELGAARGGRPRVARAAEFLFGYQEADGAFRYAPGSGKLACIAGQALAGLGRIGAAGDDRSEAGYRWLLRGQWDDGGWRCPMARLGTSPPADASNPGATLFVLDAFRFRDNTAADEQQLAAGVDTLLRHWDTRAPLGPCRFGIGSRFRQSEYPFWRYNLFYYVYVLAHYERARRDPRFADALGLLAGQAGTDGRLIVSAPPRAWRGRSFARPGRPSDLATARWREIQALTR